MACSKTIRLANQDWPLFETQEAGLCCYEIVVNSSEAAAGVLRDARAKANYVRSTKCLPVPGDKIQFYVCFKSE